MITSYALALPSNESKIRDIQLHDETWGYVIYRVGLYSVCLCHADSDGNLLLEDNIIANLHLDADYVVCCYPATVKNVYPQLRDMVVGDWDSITVLEWDSDHINVTPLQ